MFLPYARGCNNWWWSVKTSGLERKKNKKKTGKNSKEHFINSKNSGNEKKVKENYHFAGENWEKSILHGNFLAEGKKSE